MGIQSETIDFYRGYEITKHTSSVGDVMYNATRYINNGRSSYSISCAADNLEELKKQVDSQLQTYFHYKKLEYISKSKRQR